MEDNSREESYSATKLREDKEDHDAARNLIEEKADAEQLLKSLVPEFLGVYVLDYKTDTFRDIIAPDDFRKIVRENNGSFLQAMRVYAELYVAEECYGIFEYLFHYVQTGFVLAAGEPLNFTYCRKDGKFIHLQVKPYSDRKEDAHLSLWIFREASNAGKEEQELRRQLLNELWEVSNISELRNEIINAIGKIYQYISRIDIQANYYEEITGMEEYHTMQGNKTGNPSENARLMCEKRIAEEYQEEFLRFTDMSTLAQRMHEEETIEYEYQIRDGGWNRMSFVVKKRNAKGQVTHVLCLIRNISKIKQREQYLRLNVQIAREDAAQKSRFLSDMSHDIRTPMNGILGLIDLSEHNPEDAKIQTYCRNRIKETSKYLLSLVNDVLDMNKLESGEVADASINFDLTHLLRLCNEEAEKKAAQKDIDYVVLWDNTSYEHPYLIGNPLYTVRILGIIADNAIKFSKEGSRVEVWCREEKLDGEHAVFEFGCRDYGAGMSKEFIPHAFDMFAQEDMASRTHYKGTGLGLPLAKKMAERMHGVIEIHSEKNEGTTVLTRIPFRYGHQDEPGSVSEYEKLPVAGLRVLVAEDNELNMEIARYVLEDNGMLVEEAFDGTEAVAKFEQSAPGYYDIILMDILMPHLNGWDASRRIRTMEREDAQQIPIIAMSANAFSEDIMNSRIAGMDMHLAKPVERDKLIQSIKRCLREHERLMKNNQLIKEDRVD